MQKLWFSAMLGLSLGMVAGLACPPADAQSASPQKRAEKCKTSVGRGSAPTERLARLQAWEKVAQATGNWPVMTDTFKKTTYHCGKAGESWRCQASILVCRNG